jgi:hypothetical protein
LDAEGSAIAVELGTVVVVVLDGVVDVVELAGAFTENWVPVTTVTSAPSATWLGSYAMITEPEMERLTASAAASVAALREP